MPRFRFLSDEELSHFEEELKQFLIVNGVQGEEWERINQEDPEKALALVGMFSDQVLQQVYEKIEYLEKRTDDGCFVFRLMADQMYLIALQLKETHHEQSSLSNPESIHETLTNRPEDVSYFKTSKTYHDQREIELHQLLEQGAVPSSVEFWSSLEKAMTA
ncbi:MAG: hypothetical protein EP338_03270 [Bacteroidetes bacterium]|nr:MAG: hypothetical protein EP338_03270 [Bacteroidota bacterium]